MMPFDSMHTHLQLRKDATGGFSFLEVVISIAIILVSLIGVIGLLNISNSMADTAERRSAVTDVVAQVADELRTKPFTLVVNQDARPISTSSGNVIVSIEVDDSDMPGLAKTATITAFLEGNQDIEEVQTVVIRNEHPEQSGGEDGGGSGGGNGGGDTAALALEITNSASLQDKVISGQTPLNLYCSTDGKYQLVRLVARIEGGDEIGRVETPANNSAQAIAWNTALAQDGKYTVIFELWDNRPSKTEKRTTVYVDNLGANSITAPSPKTVNVQKNSSTSGTFTWTPYRDGRTEATRHKILIYVKTKNKDDWPNTPKATIIIDTANGLPTGTVQTSCTYTGFTNDYYRADIIPGCPSGCPHAETDRWHTSEKISWGSSNKW